VSAEPCISLWCESEVYTNRGIWMFARFFKSSNRFIHLYFRWPSTGSSQSSPLSETSWIRILQRTITGLRNPSKLNIWSTTERIVRLVNGSWWLQGYQNVKTSVIVFHAIPRVLVTSWSLSAINTSFSEALVIFVELLLSFVGWSPALMFTVS